MRARADSSDGVDIMSTTEKADADQHQAKGAVESWLRIAKLQKEKANLLSIRAEIAHELARNYTESYERSVADLKAATIRKMDAVEARRAELGRSG